MNRKSKQKVSATKRIKDDIWSNGCKEVLLSENHFSSNEGRSLMDSVEFHHTLPIQLRFNDVDKFGHVNNTVYFTYYDLGKTEYFTSVYPGIDWNKHGVVVVHIEANFISQISGTNSVAVQTAVTEIGNKSLTMMQQVIDTQTGEIKCFCKSIMVAFDLEKHDSQEIPEDWKNAICAFERKELRR